MRESLSLKCIQHSDCPCYCLIYFCLHNPQLLIGRNQPGIVVLCTAHDAHYDCNGRHDAEILRQAQSLLAVWRPMPSMNPLYLGALKAFAVKMFLPLFTVNAVIFLILFGSRIIPDVLIVFLPAWC